MKPGEYVVLGVWLTITAAAMITSRLRARKRPAGLRKAITRNLRGWSIAAVVHLAYAGLFIGLWTAGQMHVYVMAPALAWLSLWLTWDTYMITRMIAARRAYNRLGPLTYLAEVRYAFGPGQR